MIPFNIADHNLVFIAKGKPWDVRLENANFDKIKSLLLSGSTDEDELISLADIPTQIHVASDGKVRVVNGEVLYNSKPIENCWTSKLLRLLQDGHPVDAFMLALSSLQRNPSFMARERLPLFQEHNNLGFLPDGRLTALKAVRSDWKDKHSGTIDNSPGRTITMPRHEISDDPSVHCHIGLHVGTWEYVSSFARNDSDRILLCAFWPEHVVAVPNDNTTKIRVCEYSTLSELSRKDVAEFIERNQSMVVVDESDEDEFDDDYDL